MDFTAGKYQSGGVVSGPIMAGDPKPPYSPMRGNLEGVYASMISLVERLETLRDRLDNQNGNSPKLSGMPQPPSLVRLPDVLRSDVERAHEFVGQISNSLFGEG